jgi:uncharacterized protein YkwD
MRLSSPIAILAVSATLVAPGLAAAQSTPSGAVAGTLKAINGTRAAQGLAPVRVDARLGRAALGHSRDMVTRHYFDHVSPSGDRLGTRVARTGWTRRRPEWLLGEDLAWGTGDLATPEAVVAAWMNSPPHRRILLRRGFRVVGIGVVAGTPFSDEGATYTADFGT